MSRALLSAGVSVSEVPSVRGCVLGVVGEDDFGPIRIADFKLEACNSIRRILGFIFFTPGQNEPAQEEQAQAIDYFVQLHELVVELL